MGLDPSAAVLHIGVVESDVSVKALIRHVTRELIESREERREAGDPAVFEVDSLDIEISFVVTESTTGSGGFDLRVIRAGLDKHYDEQAVQRITLHLRAPEPGAAGEEGFDLIAPLRPRRRLDDGE